MAEQTVSFAGGTAVVTGAGSGLGAAMVARFAAHGMGIVALDLDVLDPTEADMFMPEPNGPSVDKIAVVLRETSARTTIAGVGVTGFLLADRNIAVISRLLAAAGL